MAMYTEVEKISLISKGLYRLVNDVVGPQCIVELRRQRFDIIDVFLDCDRPSTSRVTNGSVAEGFRFNSSDFDFMYIERFATVVTRSALPFLSDIRQQTILVMETEIAPAGFAYIRCLNCDPQNKILFDSLIQKGNDKYVCSRWIRENHLSSPASTTHGPCQTVTILENESDNVYTLKCPIWPRQAMNFFKRSIQHDWPSIDVLKNICEDGCLLVPIGSKQQNSSDAVDFEWRISFSLSEKKLIRSLNHCQFLCYGLSKLFLNEIIRKILPNVDLLCSYFMKTALLWEISEGPYNWTLENFLSKFWNVFRRITMWVRNGYCPNFFIPENNMFRGKICRQNQRELLSVLYDLHSEGYRCLLRSSSLNEVLSMITITPQVVHFLPCDNEEEYVPVCQVEIHRFNILFCLDSLLPCNSSKTISTSLINTVELPSETDLLLHAKKLRINYILHRYAGFLFLCIQASNSNYACNKERNKAIQTAKRIIYKTQTFFCMNYLVLAKHFYTIGKFFEAIELLEYVRHRFQSQPYMYVWSPYEDFVLMTSGMPYDRSVKSFMVSQVEIDLFFTIQELKLECRQKAQYLDDGMGQIKVPPLVFMNCLFIFCYTRIGEYHLRYDLLRELERILHNGGNHISEKDKAISWEILGICQQLCGDHQGAFVSYINALNDKFNMFKQATLARIQSLYE